MVFPKTRSANQNKSEENREIGTNRGAPLPPTPNLGVRIQSRGTGPKRRNHLKRDSKEMFPLVVAKVTKSSDILSPKVTSESLWGSKSYFFGSRLSLFAEREREE